MPPTRLPSLAAFAPALALALVASAAAAATPIAPVHLSVHDMRVTGLLRAFGETFDIELVAGGFDVDRISIEGDFGSREDALAAIVSKLHARVQDEAGLRVIAGPCTPPQSRADAPAERFFAIRGLDLGATNEYTALELLAIPHAPGSDAPRLEGVAAPPIAMHVKAGRQLPLLVHALATATGTRLDHRADGSYHVARTATCDASPQASGEGLGAGYANPHACPRFDGVPDDALPRLRPCDPLESYRLGDIDLRAVLRWNASTTLWVETRDGLTWRMEKGRHAGLREGLVEAIDERGADIVLPGDARQAPGTRVRLPFPPAPAAATRAPRGTPSAREHLAVRDVRLGALLTQIALAHRIDLVAAGFPDRRVSVEGDFEDGAAMIDAVVGPLGGQRSDVGGVMVIAGPCSPAHERVDDDGPFDFRPKLTLDFADIGERSLYVLLADFASVPTTREERDAPGTSVPVAIHVVDLPVAAIHRALAAATGTRMVAGANGTWRFRRASTCQAPPSPIVDAASPPPIVDAPSPPAPRAAARSALVAAQARDGRSRQAEATEAYPLEDFQPRGLIRVGDQRVALLETGDGRTWGIRRGRHLGFDFGLATEVDDDRLTVQEWFPNPFGYWMERRAVIDLAGGPVN